MPTIDERARLDLFTAVQDVLGAQHADTLMSLLPPVSWADVATKHDLHELERRLDHRFEAVHHQFESLEHKLTGRMEHVARTQLLAMIGAMMTFTSLVLAAVILSR